jgi:hypothetical protein
MLHGSRQPSYRNLFSSSTDISGPPTLAEMEILSDRSKEVSSCSIRFWRSSIKGWVIEGLWRTPAKREVIQRTCF